MASVNKVIILGNCGRDPEIRYLPSGQAVANVSIATSSRRKDRNSGETIEDTQWHRVTFYERLAEIAGEYLKKGHPVYIEGRLKYGKYTDQSGVEKSTVDIIATEMQLLGGRDRNDDQGGGQQPRQQQAPRQQSQGGQQQGYSQQQGRGQQGYSQPNAPRQQQRPQQQPQSQSHGPSGFDDMDDDIPF